MRQSRPDSTPNPGCPSSGYWSLSIEDQLHSLAAGGAGCGEAWSSTAICRRLYSRKQSLEPQIAIGSPPWLYPVTLHRFPHKQQRVGLAMDSMPS